MPVVFGGEGAAGRLAAELDVWTDGNVVQDKVSGASSSGSFFFLIILVYFGLIGGGVILMMMLVVTGPTGLAVVTVSVPGPLQTVQRAEFSGVILALQAADGIHLGVDNLGVVRHVGRLLDSNVGSRPAELVKDGDLSLLIGRILEMRGRDTVRISKVKGLADEGMVREGGVRELDRSGNNAADEAADSGRRRVDLAVIDARRIFAGVCGRWYPVILTLHRFFIAISRAVVNHVDGDGTALDPLIWSAGALPKRRRSVHAVRDRAFLLGLSGIWEGEWITLASAPFYSVGDPG